MAGSTVITGASGGLGAALARALARRGGRLDLIGRDAARLAETAAACGGAGAVARVHAIDILDTDALRVCLAEIEAEAPIDLFVSNAGILDGRRDGEATETIAAARAVLGTNLMAAVEGIHGVLPGMQGRRSGRILIIASLAGFSPLVDAPAYGASKAGLVSYGLALRDALRAEGIDVFVACPGYIATGMAPRHRGHRPGEITADEAAARILKALDAGKGLSGFPFGLWWPARLSLLAPEWLRRLGTRNLRFHVGTEDEG